MTWLVDRLRVRSPGLPSTGTVWTPEDYKEWLRKWDSLHNEEYKRRITSIEERFRKKGVID